MEFNSDEFLGLLPTEEKSNVESDYGKIFLQRLWKLDMSWDESLPDNLIKDWSQVLSILTSIPSITIPRFVGNQKGGVCQLLALSDDQDLKDWNVDPSDDLKKNVVRPLK